MINAQIYPLVNWLLAYCNLEEEYRVADAISASVPSVIVDNITDGHRDRVRRFLTICEQLARQFELATVLHRLERFEIALKNPALRHSDLLAEIRSHGEWIATGTLAE